MFDFLVYNFSALVLTILYLAIFMASMFGMSYLCKSVDTLNCNGTFKLGSNVEMGFKAPWWLFTIYVLVLMLILYVMVVSSSFGLSSFLQEQDYLAWI